MASCRACLGHGDLAARPGPPEFDRATRSRVLRPSRLEEVQDVFCARCRPHGEEMVIRISKGPTAADRHETRVAFFREDQPSTSPARICLMSTTMSPPFQERIHSGHRSCLHLTDCPGPATSSQATAVDQAADRPSRRKGVGRSMRVDVLLIPLASHSGGSSRHQRYKRGETSVTLRQFPRRTYLGVGPLLSDL